MSDKSFKIVGVALTPYGYKVRFANDMTRIKVLAKTDKNIELYTLPSDMSKAEAVKFLKTQVAYTNTEFNDSSAVREAIDTAVLKYNSVRTKGKRVTAGPSMESLRERAEQAEADQEVA